MTPQQRSASFWAIVLLVAFYVAPVAVALVGLPFGLLVGTAAVGQFFLSLLADPSGFVSMAQKFLIPISAGLTTATLWSEKFASRTIVLLCLTVVGLISSIVLQIYLNIPAHAADLWQPAGLPQVQTAEVFEPLLDHYLSGVSETLFTYLGILFGLQAVPNK